MNDFNILDEMTNEELDVIVKLIVDKLIQSKEKRLVCENEAKFKICLFGYNK